jgi:hypothetical protein
MSDIQDKHLKVATEIFIRCLQVSREQSKTRTEFETTLQIMCQARGLRIDVQALVKGLLS